jgi:hypothetical protein
LRELGDDLGLVESGERRAESGEWRAESGERKAESGEWRVESGEWRVESEEWERGVESGEGRVEREEWRGERGEGSGGNSATRDRAKLVRSLVRNRHAATAALADRWAILGSLDSAVDLSTPLNYFLRGSFTVEVFALFVCSLLLATAPAKIWRVR